MIGGFIDNQIHLLQVIFAQTNLFLAEMLSIVTSANIIAMGKPIVPMRQMKGLVPVCRQSKY